MLERAGRPHFSFLSNLRGCNARAAGDCSRNGPRAEKPKGNQMLMKMPIACALGVLAALACLPARAQAPVAAGATHAGPTTEIAWFDGSVEAAFEAARATHKPVLLYWGAVWCPPCQQLKATVFRRRDFLDRLTLFVPVYLDGDRPGAQIWGERFHVSGYPTVLVLRADQTELQRVSGGMDLTRYAEVLDLALDQEHTAQDVLASIDASGVALSQDDCRRLAFNAWQLEDGWSFHPESLSALADSLERAAARCPPALRVERARLLITALQATVASERKELQAHRPGSDRLAALLARVSAIVSDRGLALPTADALLMLPEEYFFAAAQADSAHRARLRAHWSALMNALATDPRYCAADQLLALRSNLMAAKGLDPGGKIPATLSTQAKRRIDGALAREHEPYARSALVDAALDTLKVLGDEDRAQAILAGEIKTAANAYYYMADLAELEERRGHPEIAIRWLARSYHEAQGPATRFQWGVRYVGGLVRMQPQEEGPIRDAAVAVLAELDAAADLHGRTRRSLGKLEASLRAWNETGAHAAAIASVRERMRLICDQLPAQDSARSACDDFLRDG